MLYFFTKSTRSAGGSRHRAFFIADFLRARGYEATLVVPPVYRADISRTQARKEYIKTILSLRRGDIAFLQNPIFNKYFIFLICLVKIIFRPTIVFDFDDTIWVPKPIAPRILTLFSDKFIVASHYLAKWPWLHGKPILVMSNLVDYSLAEKYRVDKKKGNVVLGWIGSGPASIQNLKLLVPVFEKLAAKKIPCMFRLVGALGSQELRNLFIPTGIAVEFIDTLEWGKKGEIQKANSSFDIGLCPLIDNESNRGRCSLKMLDYMATGIPVVASPVGENNYFIEDGKSGFLPKTEDEWVWDIKKLVCNATLRKNIGDEAKKKCAHEYSYQANIQKYINFLGIKRVS